MTRVIEQITVFKSTPADLFVSCPMGVASRAVNSEIRDSGGFLNQEEVDLGRATS